MDRKTSQAPIKVFEDTKEQVRLMAAVTDRTQSQIVESAVNEYLERHAEEFALGLKRARSALIRGKTDAIAYLLDEEAARVTRVSGRGGGTTP